MGYPGVSPPHHLRWTSGSFEQERRRNRSVQSQLDLHCRRLAAKVINSQIITKLSPVFAPTQLGVGVSGGIEAAVHAVHRYMQNIPSTHAIIKLDFKNAFNTIRRDAVLEASKIAIPEAYPFIHSGYASPSTLRLGSDIIPSPRKGCNKGIPSDLFSFAWLCTPYSSTVHWIEGGVPRWRHAWWWSEAASTWIVKFRAGAELKLGLTYEWQQMWNNHRFNNHLTCSIFKLWACGHWGRQHSSAPPLSPSSATDVAPKFSLGDALKLALSRLRLLHKHDTLVILRHSFSLPSLLHYSTKLILWR